MNSYIYIIFVILPLFGMMHAANNSAFKYQKSIKWKNNSDDLKIWLNRAKNPEYPIYALKKKKGKEGNYKKAMNLNTVDFMLTLKGPYSCTNNDDSTDCSQWLILTNYILQFETV